MAGDQRVTRSSRSHSQQLVGIYHMLEVRWPSGIARALNKHIKMLLDRQDVPLVALISYQFTVNRAQHRLQNAWITRCVRHNAALRWTPAHGNKAPNSGNAAPALPNVMISIDDNNYDLMTFPTPNRARTFTAAEQTFSRPVSAWRTYAGWRLRRASHVFTLQKTSTVSLG